MTVTNTTCRTWASVDDLPNELLLYIFPLFSLDSLIAARFVNRRWRHLVEEAHICPVRSKLLQIYQSSVQSPAFAHWQESRRRQSCHALSEHQKYMRLITQHSPSTPEDFRLWLHEWPAHALWLELTSPSPSDATPFPDPSQTPLPEDGYGLSSHEPCLTCVTFTGSGRPFSPGDTLYATRVLPVEFAELEDLPTRCTQLEEKDVEFSVSVLVLCFAGGRGLVLDGSRGGEKLVGTVYDTRGSYVMCAENILARNWTEYLQKDLESIERSVLAGRR